LPARLDTITSLANSSDIYIASMKIPRAGSRELFRPERLGA